MPLPLNTQTTIGGVAVVVKSVPEKSSGVNTGPSDRPANGADLAVSAYSGAPGGSAGTPKAPKGLRIPDFSGLDKALGILGTAEALIAAGKGLYSTVKNYRFDTNALRGKFATSADTVVTFFDRNQVNEGPLSTLDLNTSAAKGDRRIKISTDFSIFGNNNPYFNLLKKAGGVVFPYTPTISMTHKATYTNTEGIVHSNFPFQSYKSSQVEDITIQGEFTVQNHDEGQFWLATMHFLKTSTKMFYGASSPKGFPPPVCYLNGFGDEVFSNLPVVVKSFQIDFKDNVQYLTVDGLSQRGNKQSVPMSSTVTVIVSPIYNREEARKRFNLEDYAKGNLLGF